VADFDEAKHPRHPAGERGGQFRPKIVAGDWADELASRLRRGQYREVRDQDDLAFDGGDYEWGDLRRRGVRTWVSKDYARSLLASALRSGDETALDEVPDGSPADYTLRQTRDDIDWEIEKGRIYQPTVLWRGIIVPKEAKTQELFPYGSVVVDDSFMSTAWQLESAEAIVSWRLVEAASRQKPRGTLRPTARPQQYKPLYFQILTPAGTHAAQGAEEVAEVILGRGLRTRVVDYDATADGDPIVVLEVEP
jgi:hypothetical protein